MGARTEALAIPAMRFASVEHLSRATTAAKSRTAVQMMIALEVDHATRLLEFVLVTTATLQASYAKKLPIVPLSAVVTMAATVTPRRGTANASLPLLVHSATLFWKREPINDKVE